MRSFVVLLFGCFKYIDKWKITRENSLLIKRSYLTIPLCVCSRYLKIKTVMNVEVGITFHSL